MNSFPPKQSTPAIEVFSNVRLVQDQSAATMDMTPRRMRGWLRTSCGGLYQNSPDQVNLYFFISTAGRHVEDVRRYQISPQFLQKFHTERLWTATSPAWCNDSSLARWAQDG